MTIAGILSVLACLTSLWVHTAAGAPATDPLDDRLRLNQLQVKGTHNSYHQKPHLLLHPGWNYNHASLYEQLDVQGVRALELDLHVSRSTAEVEVYHLAVIDDRSTCQAFDTCLQEIRDWSNDHAGHVPLSIWLEIKDRTGGRKIKSLRGIEESICRYFGDRLITPDDVKGEYGSLREAIVHRGWPTLGELRGKVMFVLLNKKGRHTRTYTHNYTSLDGRVMFAKAAEDQLDLPWAVLTNVGATRVEAIHKALAQGFLVVTTACRAGMTDEACVERRKAAIHNGVQIIKDDFPAQVPDRDTWFEFPDDHPIQCNLVTAPGCRHADMEPAS